MTLDRRLSNIPHLSRPNSGCGKGTHRRSTIFLFVLAITLLVGPGRLSSQPSPGQTKPLVRRQAASSKTPAATQVAWQETFIQNNNAPVKVVEFFDYQCPYCAKTIPALDDVLQAYPGKVQLILKHTPLSIHPDSMLAHQ